MDSIADDLGFAEVLGEYNFQCSKGNALAASMPLTKYIDAWHSARLARTAAPSESDLHFNAQRLRNVATLVGLASAVPEDDATLDGARGAVLGQIAAKLRAAPAPLEARPIPTDLSKRLRLAVDAIMLAEDRGRLMLAAADEINRLAALAAKGNIQ